MNITLVFISTLFHIDKTDQGKLVTIFLSLNESNHSTIKFISMEKNECSRCCLSITIYLFACSQVMDFFYTGISLIVRSAMILSIDSHLTSKTQKKMDENSKSTV